MKHLSLLLILLIAPNCFAYTIINDPDVFYTMYENPDTTIDFTKLKNGISFDAVPDTWSELILATGSYNYVVREYSFSDDWWFRHVYSQTVINTSVSWKNGSISNYNMGIYAFNPQPFTLTTSNGFIGIIPDDMQDSHYVLGDIDIYNLEAGFTTITSTPVPEPATFMLLCSGIIGLAGLRKKGALG